MDQEIQEHLSTFRGLQAELKQAITALPPPLQKVPVPAVIHLQDVSDQMAVLATSLDTLSSSILERTRKDSEVESLRTENSLLNARARGAEDALTQLKHRHSSDESKLRKEIDQLHEERTNLSASILDLRQQLEKAKSTDRKQVTIKQLEDLQIRHTTELGSLRALHDERLNERDRSSKLEKEHLQNLYESRILDAENSRDQHRETLQREFDTRIAAERSQREAAVQEALNRGYEAGQNKQVKLEVHCHQQAIDSIEQRSTELQRKNTSLQSKLQDAKLAISVNSATTSRLASTNQNLQRDLSEAQTNLSKAQADRTTLLYQVEDMTRSVAEFRKRILDLDLELQDAKSQADTALTKIDLEKVEKTALQTNNANLSQTLQSKTIDLAEARREVQALNDSLSTQQRDCDSLEHQIVDLRILFEDQLRNKAIELQDKLNTQQNEYEEALRQEKDRVDQWRQYWQDECDFVLHDNAVADAHAREKFEINLQNEFATRINTEVSRLVAEKKAAWSNELRQATERNRLIVNHHEIQFLKTHAAKDSQHQLALQQKDDQCNTVLADKDAIHREALAQKDRECKEAIERERVVFLQLLSTMQSAAQHSQDAAPSSSRSVPHPSRDSSVQIVGPNSTPIAPNTAAKRSIEAEPHDTRRVRARLGAQFETPTPGESSTSAAESSAQANSSLRRSTGLIPNEEREQLANSIWSLMHRQWDISSQEEQQLLEQFASLFSRGRTLDSVKKAIDKHVVGSFIQKPQTPRPCLIGTLVGEGGGRGGDSMTQGSCPYCKRNKARICVWADYAPGVASGFGDRDPQTNIIVNTEWNPHPSPETVDVNGQEVRYILHRRQDPRHR